MSPRSIRTIIVCAAAGGALTVGGLAAVSAASETPKDRPTFGIDPGGKVAVPEFAAVSDGHGGIAGYSEVAIMDGTDYMPKSPKEALEMSANEGIIFRVFDTSARTVGYFRSQARHGDQPGGFIDRAEKNALVAKGWRYIEGSTPKAIS